MVNDDLGKRMKKYEFVTRNYLTTRTPVIIRVDGRSFHTFTKGFKKPFDDILVRTMQDTMKYLCENIQGCVLGYAQSDEITLVLVDYKKLNSDAWFDYNIQKCASIAASMATMAFNKAFLRNSADYALGHIMTGNEKSSVVTDSYYDALSKAVETGAVFDARVFNIPKEEVCNCLLWRQLDAIRNSIQMVGQANFSHNELQNKTCNQIQEMLFSKRGINWNDTPSHLKRGSCCIRKSDPTNICRKPWTIDMEIPDFKGEGRAYVDDLIVIQNED